MARLLGICISEKKGTRKYAVPEANLIEDWGIEGDAHAGKWHRQVSLLGAEKIKAFQEKGAKVEFGDFGENLIIDGFDFRNMPVTTRFQIGETILEMTQIGKECHTHCAIYHRMGDCIMPREGVFTKVIKGGQIKVGDEVIDLGTERTRIRAAVITLSDKASKQEREDSSGPLIAKWLKGKGYIVEEALILPDEKQLLKKELLRLSDGRQMDCILTTGGTGLAPRDITPEATMEVADKIVPGIAEALRLHSMKYTAKAMLSRGASVIRGNTLIINLPGSPKAVAENLKMLEEALVHGLSILKGSVQECAR